MPTTCITFTETRTVKLRDEKDVLDIEKINAGVSIAGRVHNVHARQRTGTYIECFDFEVATRKGYIIYLHIPYYAVRVCDAAEIEA